MAWKNAGLQRRRGINVTKAAEEGYRKDTMEKMDLYRASGIYPGKNLIFTYETDDHPLDIGGMRKMLHEIFCEGE